MNNTAAVIGAGLAGCEAALRLADAGVSVLLCEMKPCRRSPAHQSDNFAELVCSNSLKALRVESAAGLLKEEMRLLGSACMEAALACRVPAGGALAVDRERFSGQITERVTAHPNITVQSGEVTGLPQGPCIVATGPLTSDALTHAILDATGSEALSFFDAAAPIVTAESLDFSRAFCASRYDRGGDDYVNCPLNKEEYEAFYAALISAERAQLHEFDRRNIYEGCMPIEVMASRGADTIRFGPMKPVGLRDPHTGHRPWANLQLRRENEAGTLYNLVGFQTNLKFAEQKRVFSMIPALKNAEFVRYGVMHRNTFLNSPRLLNPDLSLKTRPDLFFAGQLTGVEGYMESAAMGILAGENLLRHLRGEPPLILPPITMIGALAQHVTAFEGRDFQPMGASMGLLPPLAESIRDKRQRAAALAARSVEYIRNSGMVKDENGTYSGI